MQDASDGIGTAKDAFDRLGLGVTNADGSLKSLDTMFFEIGDKIKNMDDRTLAAANAAEIFGTGMGAKLIPIMNQGSEAIQNLSTGFTQLNAERMAAFNDKVAQMGEKFNVLKVQLTEVLLLVLPKIVDIISDAAKKFAKLPGPVKAISVAFALIVPAIIAIAPVIAALIVSFKTIAAVKMGVVIAKITTAFGGVLGAVKAAIVGFAPLLAGAAIPLAIIGLGVLIFKFRDQIGNALKGVGQFFVNAFSPLTNFIGNIFNGAMDLARNAFNRLPNIVQEAIKFATAPLRGFINFLQNILNMLGRVRDAKSNPPKPPKPPTSLSSSASSGGSASGLSSSSGSSGSSGLYASSSNVYTSALSGSSSSSALSGSSALSSSSGSSGSNTGQSSSSSLTATELPSGGYSITQSSRPPKPPNINIQTGNVVQMDNTNYVTTQDLERAVSSATRQTFNYIEAGGVRHYL